MYEMKGRIRYSETDEHGKLSIAGLMNLLQDCCTMQAEDLGIGLSYLMANKIGWFVTKYQIKITGSLPSIGEEVVVRTWPHAFRGFLGYRNFTLEDGEGKTCVMADSLWILMNLETQKPVRLPEKMLSAYVLESALPGEWNLRKRPMMEDGVFDYEFQVEKLYLDTNHHMNNERYIEAARECVRRETLFREIYVEFKKPAVLGDFVRCSYSETKEGVQVALCDGEGECYALVEFGF